MSLLGHRKSQITASSAIFVAAVSLTHNQRQCEMYWISTVKDFADKIGYTAEMTQRI